MTEKRDWKFWLRKRKRDYEAVFETEPGQRVLMDLATECGFNQDPFVPNDPYTTAYHVGKQRIMLHIRSILGMSELRLRELSQQIEERQLDELGGMNP